MKRVLNLNQFAGRWIALSVLLAIVIPGALIGGYYLILSNGYEWQLLLSVAGISALTGLFLLGILLILIVLEQIQDRTLYWHYLKTRSRRIRISEGRFECPYCGNCEVQEVDTSCAICGNKLDK